MKTLIITHNFYSLCLEIYRNLYMLLVENGTLHCVTFQSFKVSWHHVLSSFRTHTGGVRCIGQSHVRRPSTCPSCWWLRTGSVTSTLRPWGDCSTLCLSQVSSTDQTVSCVLSIIETPTCAVAGTPNCVSFTQVDYWGPIRSRLTGTGWHPGSTWLSSGPTVHHGLSFTWRRLTEFLNRPHSKPSTKGLALITVA